MRKLILSLLVALIGSSVSRAVSVVEEPDFAFPQTVISNADSVLRVSKSPVERIAAVMQIAAAKFSVDNDSIGAVNDLLASAAADTPDPAARALLDLYRAQALGNYYSRYAYRFNMIKAPITPLPPNPQEWSGEQFKSVIKELINRALNSVPAAKNIDISDYKEIIYCPDNSRLFYPKVSDFIYLASVQTAGLINDKEIESKIRTEALASEPVGTPQWAVWLENDFDRIREVFEKYPTGLTGGYLLYKSLTNSSYLKNEFLIGALRNYLSTESPNIFTQYLDYRYKELTLPNVSVGCLNTAYPDTKLKVKVNSQFADSINVELYRVKDPRIENKWNYSRTNAVLVDTKTITTDTPDLKLVDSVFFDIKDPGIYLVCPSLGNETTDKLSNYVEVIVTPYVQFTVRANNEYATALVSLSDGSPVKDADLTIYTTDRGNKNYDKDVFFGRTDNQGIARAIIPKGLFSDYYSANIFITKGKNKYYLGNRNRIYYSPDYYDIDNLDAQFFVSRPIYHPGDEVEWAMVLGRYDAVNQRAQVCSGIEVDINLRDPNYEVVDSITLSTDENGRVHGSFRIPVDRLTGYYTLELSSTSYAHLIPENSTKSFMVSDFKPADTELKDIKVVLNEDGSTTVTGRLMTMSGMGIDRGQVQVSFSPETYWWWRRFNKMSAKSANIETTTDAEGYFSVTTKADELSPKTDYTVSVRAVAPSGETADAITYLYNCDVVTVMSDSPSWNTDNTKPLPIYAVRSERRLDTTADWTLLCDGKSVASGTCRIDSTGTDIDLAAYPAATYKLAFKFPANYAVIGDTVEVTTYSVERNAVPKWQKLLVPVTNFNIGDGESGTFKVGVYEKTPVYIFYISTTGIKTVERKIFNPGFHDIKLPAFKSGEQTRIIIAALDGDSFDWRTVIVNCENLSQLDLKIESWRDRLIPNTTETITFRLSHLDGTPVSGGFVATMYNRALDDLQHLQFPNSKDMFARFTLNSEIDCGVNAFITKYNGTSVKLRNVNHVYYSFGAPVFSYIVFFTPYRRYNRSRATSLRSTANGAIMDMGEDMVLNEVAQPMAALVSAKIQEDNESADEAAAGSPAPDPQAPADVYREGEVLQAFFRPDMSFGPDGSATLTYTVPNANGSWKFIATAWDRMAYCDTQVRTAVASKPVMVQPNAPRFLREGDSAEISVAVFNNTPDDGSVSCMIEIFDPNTGEIISSESSQFDVRAGASVIRPVSVTAPVGSQGVGLRAKATLGNYTDGEQNLIPVLPSGMTVIDSETFYLTDANPDFVSTVPASDGPADFTLQYCANPVWDVVKALPSLYDASPRTAIDAAYSIYSALTARGLSRRFPEINQAIGLWTANPADSALVSKLYKNEDLKLATLQQTPWMQAAASQTERMSQLSVTFDKAEINRTFDAAVEALGRLQRADGGFAWGSWSDRSSLWTTESVLMIIGRLNSWGFLTGTEKLDKIINRAFGYVDASVRDTDFSYALLMAYYPDRKPSTTGAQTVLHNTLQYAAANWRKASTAQKARWAVLLDGHGYGAVAKEIVASLRQFEVRSPQAGISFPSVNSVDTYATILQAFAMIDPIESELDAMRQWLVLRTQVSDDLMACDRRSLISAILSTGSRWAGLRAAKAPVTVGGAPLEIDRIEAVTGAFSVRLPAEDAGKGIRVSRPAGSGLSYGSLTSVYSKPLDQVEPRGSSEISIAKRFLVERDGQWVETTSVSVGELVRVQLKIQTSRDMEYLTVIDQRPAAFEPVDQVPGYVYSGGTAFYRENNDAATNLFIGYLPRGTYYITYDMNVSVAGTFASGPATVQSQYAPELNARSGSSRISVRTFGTR